MLVFAAVSCGRAGDVVPDGAEGGACYGNGTCDAEMSCSESNLCVVPAPPPDDCNGRRLLWSTSFEPNESAPGSVGQDGGVVSSSNPRTGARTARVDDGLMIITTPWPFRVRSAEALVSYWMTNGNSPNNEYIELYLRGSSGDLSTSSAQPSSDNARFGWTHFSAGFQISNTSAEYSVEINAPSNSNWIEIDDV